MIQFTIPDPTEIPWWAWALAAILLWYVGSGVYTRRLLAAGFFETEVFGSRCIHTAEDQYKEALFFWACTPLVIPVLVLWGIAVDYLWPYGLRAVIFHTLWAVSGGLVARRTEAFRLFAVRMRRRYATVAVEDVNWRDEVLKKPAAEKDAKADYVRKLHRIAAPGSLVAILTEQMRHTVRVDPAHTTKTCHACGTRCEFDAAVTRTHVCEFCGVAWDQDVNAARNLLAAV